MTLDFSNGFDYEYDLMKLEYVCDLTLQAENFGYEAEISLSFVDNDEIRSLNKRYRKIDKETDVLSFPCYSLTPGSYANSPELANAKEPVMLGDIVISIEKAESQANEYGHSLLRELAFLTAHSVLHLLGYDHLTDDEASIMFAKQEEILQNAGINRHTQGESI